MAEDSQVLINADAPDEALQTKTTYRWVILGIFSFFSLVQSGVWDTWGPISSSATVAIGFTEHDYDLLSNWAPIGILPTMPFFIWLINTKGPRLPVVVSSLLVAIGTGLRCLPLPASTLKYFIHAGQFLNAIAGCAVLGAAPQISNTWFLPSERITATSCMILLGNLGNAFSYLLGPAIVESPNNCTTNSTITTTAHTVTLAQFESNFTTLAPATYMTTACTDNKAVMRQQINTLCYIEFAMGILVFLLMLFLFKNKPGNAPSASAAAERLAIWAGLKALAQKPTFWIFILSYSLVLGAFYGWYGIITVLLTPHGLSQNEVGLIAFVMTVAGTVVGIPVGWVGDRLKGRTKWIMFGGICLMFLTFLYLTIIIMEWISVAPFVFTKAGFWVSFLLFGITANAIQPIGFEMAADIAFPVSEGTSASVNSWLIMLLMFIFLTILNSVKNQQVANYLVLAFCGLAAPILAIFTKNRNVRMEIDN